MNDFLSEVMTLITTSLSTVTVTVDRNHSINLVGWWQKLPAAKAITWLQKETAIRVKDQFRCVGGRDAVTPQLLAQCFERMSAWVTITKEALQAEFPSFEALSAFSVLQLRPKLDATVVKRDLAKVCKIFGEEPELPQLCRSFCDVEYTALKRRPLVALLQISSDSDHPLMLACQLSIVMLIVLFNFLFVIQCLRRPDLWQGASGRPQSLDPCPWRKASSGVQSSFGEIRWTGNVLGTNFHFTLRAWLWKHFALLPEAFGIPSAQRDALALELPQWRAWEAWWDHQRRHGNLERRVQVCSVEWPPAAGKLCLAFDHGEEKTGYLTLIDFENFEVNDDNEII